MKNIFKFLILILLATTTVSFAESLNCKNHLKIGVSLPLTGSGPIAAGNSVKNSIELADKLYDKNNCVDFDIQDDSLQAKNTLTNVNKFITLDNDNAIVVFGTNTSLAVNSIAEQAHVPMVALSILKKVVQDKKYVVKHWCTDINLNDAIKKEVQKKNYKSVAIVTLQNEAMLGLRELFKKDFTGDILLDEEFAQGDLDFGTIITKIKAKNPEAVYILLFPPQTGVFIKKLRELGFNKEIFGVHNLEDPNEVKVAGSTIENAWFANADDSKGENYKKLYLDTYRQSPGLGGASGFDVAKMFIEFSKSKNADLNNYLHTIKDFSGAFGIYSVTPNNDFDFPAVIKIIKNGEIILEPSN